MSASIPAPIVEMQQITRHFGQVIALSDVSFDVRAGECHLPAWR